MVTPEVLTKTNSAVAAACGATDASIAATVKLCARIFRMTGRGFRALRVERSAHDLRPILRK
jgi:hypothetical protein